ncbi:peptidase family M13 [Oesophagostomum dentatum]|uniref:Peptidase family M13 n=1 Tax=Oesophagostomum dentatum TaxID=61180 RepID=A0A0B1TJ23_OESDE|nr:peptidase family M13 [Oesophagostomum dentatum]
MDIATSSPDQLGSEWNSQFDQRALCLLEHYNNSEILFYEKGKAIKTNLTNKATQTWEEDLVDNEGIKLSFRAYRTYMKKHEPEARFANSEAFNSDQIFFIGFALHFCAAYSREGLEFYLKTNEHSIHQLRVNRVVSNQPEFAEAFHCAPGKQLNPKKRCSIY